MVTQSVRGNVIPSKGQNITVVGIMHQFHGYPESRATSEGKAECSKGWGRGEGNFQQLYVPYMLGFAIRVVLRVNDGAGGGEGGGFWGGGLPQH